MKKRILAILLCVCLMIPMFAQAISVSADTPAASKALDAMEELFAHRNDSPLLYTTASAKDWSFGGYKDATSIVPESLDDFEVITMPTDDEDWNRASEANPWLDWGTAPCKFRRLASPNAIRVQLYNSTSNPTYRYTAPKDGTVAITYDRFWLRHENVEVEFAVYKNETQIWPATAGAETLSVATKETDITPDFSSLSALTVAAGDKIEFRFHRSAASGSLEIDFNPVVTYAASAAPTYTVTYTDGVEDAEIFADRAFGGLAADAATPAFGEDPTREGYTFKGWTPAVADTVTADATYTAVWEEIVTYEPDKAIDAIAALHADRKNATTGSVAIYGNWTFGGYKKDENVLTPLSLDVDQWRNYPELTGEGGNANPWLDWDKSRTGTAKLRWESGNNKIYLAGEHDGFDTTAQFVAPDNGTVTLSSGIEASLQGLKSLPAAKFAVYKNGTVIWPANGEPMEVEVIEEGVAAVIGSDFGTVDVKAGDKIDFRVTWVYGDVRVHIAPQVTYTVKTPTTYTVTYTDGVEDAEIFADQVTAELEKGAATPVFSGDTPTREGYEFKGWSPEVTETVTGTVTYTAVWAAVYPAEKGYDALLSLYNQRLDDDAATSAVWGNWAFGGYRDATSVSEAAGEFEALALPTDDVEWNDASQANPWLDWDAGVEGLCKYRLLTGDKKITMGAVATTFSTTIQYTAPMTGTVSLTAEQGQLRDNGAAVTFGIFKNGTMIWPADGNAKEIAGGESIDKDYGTVSVVKGDKIEYRVYQTSGDGQFFFNPVVQYTEVLPDPFFTVTYTDGVEDAEIFADVVFENVAAGAATPAFGAADPTRAGYTFTGWAPEVAATVSENVTYVAQWVVTPTFTVTYTDGVADEEVFADQSYTVEVGAATPSFVGTPTREGYIFRGWSPMLGATVTADITYKATWAKDDTPKYTLGDVNNDGAIDATDALDVLKFYAKVEGTTINEAAADVDGNGAVDATDALLILKYYAKVITEFPAAK